MGCGNASFVGSLFCVFLKKKASEHCAKEYVNRPTSRRSEPTRQAHSSVLGAEPRSEPSYRFSTASNLKSVRSPLFEFRILNIWHWLSSNGGVHKLMHGYCGILGSPRHGSQFATARFHHPKILWRRCVLYCCETRHSWPGGRNA